MTQNINSQDHWILISGVSRGLGLELSQQLLESGWCVAGLSSTKSEGIDKLKHQFRDGFFWQQLDIANCNAIDGLVEKARHHFKDKNLWAVINNAGVSVEGILATLPVVDIERVLQVNLTGAIVLARAGLRRMMQQKTGGRIINISSITGSRGYTGLSSYAASKAGMDGFTRALAREVGRLGITVNSIAPGYMKTALSQGLDEKQLMQIVRRTPLGRLCTLEDIVDLTGFLISNKSSFITGQVMTVDGGLTN
jgi:3-oxoacyl-[acyl-carrier protein] reductase